MFTLNEIKKAHSKVKSGADFPQYIQELISLGVEKYETYVEDGHVKYFGSQNRVESEPNYAKLEVLNTRDTQKLQEALKIHQEGKTNYLTFCSQVAQAGVAKWQVDTKQMTCTYFDKDGNAMVLETIPTK